MSRKHLSEIYTLLLENGYTPGDMVRFINKIRNDVFMSLLTSEWFSFRLISYLSIKDLTILDTSICHHSYRKLWLSCLMQYTVDIVLNWTNPMKLIIDWIIMKNVKVSGINLNYGNVRLKQYFADTDDLDLTDETMFLLTYKNPKIKEITIRNENITYSMSKKCFEYIGTCRHLEVLKIVTVNMELNTFDVLMSSLTQLKCIHLHLETYMSLFPPSSSEYLALIGKHCSFIEEVDVYSEWRGKSGEMSDIEIFTKGCRYLKYLEINELGRDSQHSILLNCLGKYNQFLETLHVNSNLSRLEVITSDTLETLMKGCSVLKDIELSQFYFNNQSLSCLAMYCASLEKIDISFCRVSEEDIMEISRLQRLQSLEVMGCVNVTDEFILQLVINNPSLKHIGISCCSRLTNSSLNYIGLYSHELTSIFIDNIDGNQKKYSKRGFWKLFNKCKYLVTIETGVVENAGTLRLPRNFLRAIKKRKALLKINK